MAMQHKPAAPGDDDEEDEEDEKEVPGTYDPSLYAGL